MEKSCLEEQLNNSSAYSQKFVHKWLENYGVKNIREGLQKETIQNIATIKNAQGVGYSGPGNPTKANTVPTLRMKKTFSKQINDKKSISKPSVKDKDVDESRTDQLIKSFSSNRTVGKSMIKRGKYK